MLVVEESSCEKLKTRTLFSFLSQPDPSRVGKTLGPSCKNCVLSCRMCLEKGNFKGTQRCTNPFVADWEWHLEKEVACSHIAGLAQLKISACTLCCLPLVLNLSCRCEILFWRTQQGWDRQSFYVSSRFWDWRSCVCVRVCTQCIDLGCETRMCWPRCPSSILFHKHLLEC